MLVLFERVKSIFACAEWFLKLEREMRIDFDLFLSFLRLERCNATR
jgi:hypothetical protein